jgi:alpha-L-fucosidase 2
MLAGWYPGYSIGTYGWNSTITDAVNTSLTARGNGTVDSNTGWEKVWRVACWAQLNNTDIAYALSFFLFTLHSNLSTKRV